jgi:hypothetical protein
VRPVVALALALTATPIFYQRRVDAKDKCIAELEEGWRDELRTSLGSGTKGVATLEKAGGFMLEHSRDRR